MSFNLPNPSLLGILLVISTHTGPHIVLSYPQDVSKDASAAPIDISDDESEYFEGNEEEYGLQHANDYNLNTDNQEWDANHFNYYMGTRKDLILFLDDQERRRQRAHEPSAATATEIGPSVTKVNSRPLIASSYNQDEVRTIFGIEPAYLGEMLAPPRKMCNSRFELMIDDKVFLGLPMHRHENGRWRNAHQGSSKLAEKPKKSKKLKRKSKDEEDKNTDGADALKGNMSMFHLVFVMNPPTVEFNYRIDDMFHYVTSRVSLALRYEQLKNEYVSKQSRLILELKDQCKSPSELEYQLSQQSQLYKVISLCFHSISTSKIANLNINNKLRSFQIPIKTEFQNLPEVSVPYIPGSHLSSTLSFLGASGLVNMGESTRYGQTADSQRRAGDNEQDINESSISDDLVYFALMLLDDPETIIKDIKADSNSMVAVFIRSIKPTESLHKLSTRNNSIPLSKIQSFALHLIYWRRARVIQPLSTRCTYIVSPMAPISLNMFQDIKTFKNMYPSLPSLPQFLKLLSPQLKKPQQFATIVPSKDHKDIYLDALSWLVRHGYVTQLLTFIWLKVSRKVKMKVEEELENESQKKKSNLNKEISVGTDNTSKKQPFNHGQSSAQSQSVQQDSQGLARQHSLKSVPKATATGNTISNSPTQLSSLLSHIKLEDDEDTILSDPARATTLERRWINRIIFEECNLSNELIAIFYKLLKYMNGKLPLELLLLKENISRTELRKLLFAIEDHIISVRHW